MNIYMYSWDNFWFPLRDDITLGRKDRGDFSYAYSSTAYAIYIETKIFVINKKLIQSKIEKKK